MDGSRDAGTDATDHGLRPPPLRLIKGGEDCPGYGVLEEVIARVSGQSYEEFMRERGLQAVRHAASQLRTAARLRRRSPTHRPHSACGHNRSRENLRAPSISRRRGMTRALRDRAVRCPTGLSCAEPVREKSAKQQRQNPADNAEPDDSVGEVVQVCGILAHAARYSAPVVRRRRGFSVELVLHSPAIRSNATIG